MKIHFVFLITLISLQAHAVSWEVIGPCSETPVYSGAMNLNSPPASVGDFSVQVFDANKIPYIGSEMGFNSIVNTPTDRNSIEIVSKTELRAYGWCYSVNGEFPEQMPHEAFFPNNEAKLIWFYAYSTIKNNQWQDDYCTPAYNIKAEQFCDKK